MDENLPEIKYVNPFSESALEIGRKIDVAVVANNLDELKILAENALNNIETLGATSQAFLFYCVAIATGEIARLEGNCRYEMALEKQLYYFRKCISLYESEELNKLEYFPFVSVNRCTTHTNYANALKQAGRIISAIEEYEKAIAIIPDFGMALGLLGRAYQHYARLVSDNGHRHYLHHCAYYQLKSAIASADPNMFLEAKNSFQDSLTMYNDTHIEVFEKMDLSKKECKYSCNDELDYRQWVLCNGLFLHPLNDLPYTEFIFATDALTLPGITVRANQNWDDPVFHKMFNQLKQEFIYSRWLLYCGVHEGEDVHFADRDTYLSNTLDYSQHSIRLEQLKSAFKTAYSLFDKVAFFINVYYELGIKDGDVTYNKLWKNQALLSKDNYALDALRWIYKDFRIKLSEATQPNAERLYKIRNFLEHRFVKISWDFVSDITEGDFNADISETELKDETFILLNIAREALIYLSFMVHIEEYKQNENRQNTLTAPIILQNHDDEWKI